MNKSVCQIKEDPFLSRNRVRNLIQQYFLGPDPYADTYGDWPRIPEDFKPKEEKSK